MIICKGPVSSYLVYDNSPPLMNGPNTLLGMNVLWFHRELFMARVTFITNSECYYDTHTYPVLHVHSPCRGCLPVEHLLLRTPQALLSFNSG